VKKIILMIVTVLIMITLVAVPTIAVAEKQVIPGSVKRETVIRIAKGYVRPHGWWLLPPKTFKDEIETFYEKGNKEAVFYTVAAVDDMLFMYTHPKIRIEPISFVLPPGERATDYMMSRIAEGTAPSIFRPAGLSLYEAAKEEIIADITDYVKTWHFYKKVPAWVWERAMIKGRIYGFPCDVENDQCIIFRKDYFKEAGIFNKEGEAAPPDNWTAEDFIEVCQKIAGSKKGRYGIGINEGVRGIDMGTFGDFGLKPDPTGKYTWRADFDTPGKRYFEWLRRLLKSGSVLYGIGENECADFFSGRAAMWRREPGTVVGWISMWGPHSHGEFTPEVDISRDIRGARFPAGPEGIIPNTVGIVIDCVLGTQTKEEIEASMEYARWCYDEDPNPLRALHSVVWWISGTGDAPKISENYSWSIVERPGVYTYDHDVVHIPGQPNSWKDIPNVEWYRPLVDKIRAVPTAPRPEAYGVYEPEIGTQLVPVFQLLMSDPDADIEKELSKAEKLLNSTILNYKDKDITKKEFQAYYTALGEFYKENYPEYYNKYFAKLLEEHYKVW